MTDPLASAAVWHLKYRGIRSMARPLAHLMARRWASTGNPEWFSESPLLVPVPLHPERLDERGYNQAELLACELGRITAMTVAPDALARVRRTASQVQAHSRRERLENMHGAFRAMHPERVAGRDIILIDDVCTTGATLQACTIALRSAGARKVHAMVLARG
jgi:ComF family protein